MSLRYSLAIPACVVENMKARQAIRRSIELAKGRGDASSCSALLVGVIKLGLVVLTQFFIFVAAFKHRGQMGPGLLALSQIIGFFTNTFLGPIWAAGITLFYYDQRVRKEGFDIEWMMQAAGLTPPAPAAPAEAGYGSGRNAAATEPWLALDAHFEPPAAAEPASTGQEPAARRGRGGPGLRDSSLSCWRGTGWGFGCGSCRGPRRASRRAPGLRAGSARLPLPLSRRTRSARRRWPSTASTWSN